MASESAATLRSGVGHAVADRQPTAWSGATVGDKALGGMHPAEHEGDLRPGGAMEERNVFDGFAKRSATGMDFAAVAEERDRLELRLAVDPVRPTTAVGFEETPSHIRDGGQAGFQELVVDDEGAALLHELLEAGVVVPDGVTRAQDQIETEAGEGGDDRLPVGPEPLQDSVFDIELERQLGARPQPIDLAKGSAVLGRQPATRHSQHSAGMERDPGNINLVRIRLHQHREMEG